ncbi:hypothetical protein F2Q69_00028884 [Brassica cretica]|uniref:Uncharacterized protein n=1 Tax=Brassica cretica TaxID=69181 RepID=A0A8S9SD66_BRACR|nr:hypothetical protein F2Q69_00028884 [Brassica cretica]
MVATIVLIQNANGDLHDQEGHLHNAGGDESLKHHVNAIKDDDFWQVVKEDKLQEGDFEVESSMSFRSSHWGRPTPREEHRPMESDEHRSIPDTQHRSTVHTESVASCETVRIMTHEEFGDKHPHPLKPYRVTTKDIDRHHEPVTDQQRDSTDDRQSPHSINRRPPLTYRVLIYNGYYPLIVVLESF